MSVYEKKGWVVTGDVRVDWPLPAGWRRTEMLDNTVILTNQRAGHVTVSLKRRGFALGYGARVAVRQATNNYTGEGWRERLFADAAAALDEIYKAEK